MTLLHAIVKYDPPLDIVAQILEFCPDMPAAEDCLRRTPLHVATRSRAPASLIELLARAHPAACDAQDEERKTPLHFACDSSCVLFESDSHESGIIPRQPPNHEAERSCYAVTLEDDEDMTPLEHAIQSNASMETVKLLQQKLDEPRS
jgi:ankyrin repeat protein